MENFDTYRLDQTGQQTQAILDQVATNTADIEQLRALYEALTQSEPVIIQPSDTWPVADPQENVIYRVIDRVNTPPQSYSDYMWNGTSMVLMATYNNSIDNEPTPGSNNLVKSGGVAASIVFDISAYHATGSTLATYSNLVAALGTDGANVPASVRKGGMSVKFVQSSDNKYVQYRLMADEFSTTVTDWQGVDDEPTAGSDNLVKSGGIQSKLSVISKDLNNTTVNAIGRKETTLSINDFHSGVSYNAAFEPEEDQSRVVTDLYIVNIGTKITYSNLIAYDKQIIMTYDKDRNIVQDGCMFNGSVSPYVVKRPDIKYIQFCNGAGGSPSIIVSQIDGWEEITTKTVGTLFDRPIVLLDKSSLYNTNPIVQNYDGDKDWQRGYLADTGRAYYDNTERITNYIKCLPGKKYHYYGKLAGTASICFYTEDKRYISGISANEIGKQTDFDFTTPNLCGYFKLGCAESGIDSFDILFYDEVSGINNVVRNITTSYSEDIDKELGAYIIRSKSNGVEPVFMFKTFVGDSLYLHLKVKFPEDVNNIDEIRRIVSLRPFGTNDNYTAVLLKKPTSIIPSHDPVPLYNSGLYSTYSDLLPQTNVPIIKPNGADFNLLLGNDAMSIRFVGDLTDESNHDIMLTIDDEVVKIYHSSDDSIIRSYTKSSYTTIKELYQAIKSDIDNNVLPDFEITWYSIDYGTPNDFINCTVHLVNQYQQYAGGTQTNPVLENKWDSFPFYFTTKEKGRIYDLEIVIDKENIAQFIIDGYGIPFTENNVNAKNSFLNNYCYITIGDKVNNSRNPEVISFEVSDIPNFKYPNLRVFFSEQTIGGLNSGSSYFTSEERIAELAKLLAQNNYSNVDYENMCNYLDGITELKGNIYHIAQDDTGSIRLIGDGKVKRVFSRNGIVPSYGMQMQDQYSDAQLKELDVFYKKGYRYYPHGFADESIPTEAHDGSMGYLSYKQMVKVVNDSVNFFVNTFGIYPTTWNFHLVAEGYNQIRYLINHGFRFIFGLSGNGLLTNINRYHCRRAGLSDAKDFSQQIEKHLNNYLAVDL